MARSGRVPKVQKSDTQNMEVQAPQVRQLYCAGGKRRCLELPLGLYEKTPPGPATSGTSDGMPAA